MTKTKQLTGALALLASIAVLDNLVFIELDPAFEGMTLIELNASTGVNQANGETDEFWIDRNKIGQAEFTKFLEATGYVPQAPPSYKLETVIIDSSHSAFVVTEDKNPTQYDGTYWKKQDASYRSDHMLLGQGDLRVSFEDATAYCNWLGKKLPTEEQARQLISNFQDDGAETYFEFRCAKNN